MATLRTLFLPALAAATLAACESDPVAVSCAAPQVAIPSVAGDTVTLESGTRYIEFETGDSTATAVTDSSTVLVDYNGYLRDGTLFDSQVAVQFSLTQVIPGFRNGLVGLREGGARRIIIPPSQGYGDAGAGQCIPGNATLIFDVGLRAVAS